jgi:hypothetical protein
VCCCDAFNALDLHIDVFVAAARDAAVAAVAA